MADIRRADPAAQRRAVWILVAGTCVGSLLIAAFERYRIPLTEWVAGGQGDSSKRVVAVFLVVSGLLLAPLLGFAAYLWSLGGRAIRAREFPPPGVRVIRDTMVLTGEKAVSRGGLLKALAVGTVVAFAALVFFLCRFALLIVDRA